METEKLAIPTKRLSLAEAFAGLPHPCVAGRSKHDVVEVLVVTMCSLVCGVEDFVGVEALASERIGCLRRFLILGSGVLSCEPFDRLFGLLARHAVEKGFRCWLGSVLLASAEGTVVTMDGKARRRGKMTGQSRPCIWSAPLPRRHN